MKIFLIEQENYREWTESLGHDREWKIQEIQHQISNLLNRITAENNGFLLPLRYDFLAIIADGLSNQSLIDIYNKATEISPTKIKACLGYGKTPLEAERNAFNCIHKSDHNLYLDKLNDEIVTVCHFDIDNFTSLTLNTSAYDAIIHFNNIYYKINDKLYRLGGLTQYLGGDNFISFINYENIKDIISMVNEIDNIKVGIGIGTNARNAMENATKALDNIRKTRDKKWEISQSTLELRY
ncbi:GTP cyclohydrolase IIa [Acidianus manzaensis]|uniref:GTP cyclohydrolase III n=1 Tax=Acidianus manzaensis TaxID=282676 RepID=A0A1W6JZW1_9CREN|nr:GTP cyclohydrolase IIa [Acidianus manzaensis]ARM75823.1 hypothetical protein B6F84_07075 [Acidianus manzaensis]